MPKPKPITTKGNGHHHDQLRPIRTYPRAWERDQSPESSMWLEEESKYLNITEEETSEN